MLKINFIQVADVNRLTFAPDVIWELDTKFWEIDTIIVHRGEISPS
jgi:hypothetical protein